jgi:hypothetical protein
MKRFLIAWLIVSAVVAFGTAHAEGKWIVPVNPHGPMPSLPAGGAPLCLGVPDPTQIYDDGDVMLGNARGMAIMPGLPCVRATITDGYQVTVRDCARNPVLGVKVTIDFSGSAVGPHQTQSAGQAATCPAPGCPSPGGSISLITNALGQVTFFPATVGMNSAAGANVAIWVAPLPSPVAAIRFRSLDLVCSSDGVARVDVADLNAFRCRFLNLTCQASLGSLDPACDYATEGTSAGKVDIADLNVFRVEFLCGAGGPVGPPCTQTQCP